MPPKLPSPIPSARHTRPSLRRLAMRTPRPPMQAAATMLRIVHVQQGGSLELTWGPFHRTHRASGSFPKLPLSNIPPPPEPTPLFRQPPPLLRGPQLHHWTSLRPSPARPAEVRR